MKHKIIVITVPFTFADRPLIPLEFVPLETMRFVTWLKNKKNDVYFINMRSRDHYFWRDRAAGLHGKKMIPMQISSRTMNFLKGELEKNSDADEVILQCDFFVMPFIFDMDVIHSLENFVKEKLPKAKVFVNGALFYSYKDLAKKHGFDEYDIDSRETLDLDPDIEASLKCNGGKLAFFQLTSGCMNKCSFCASVLLPVHYFSIEKNIDYLKKMEAAGVMQCSSLDLNIMSPEINEQFLQMFIDSGLKSVMIIPLGFQPNRITDSIINLLKKINIKLFSVPFDSGTSQNCKNVQKAYTIISSIKLLHKLRKELNIYTIKGSNIIGYKHDDIRSIFRVYFAICRGGGIPIVLPVYIFPNTKEYYDNISDLKDRDITYCHGDLWPLVSEEKIPFYKKLLYFLNIDDYSKALAIAPRIFDSETMRIFRQEQHRSAYFTKRCLESEKEDLNALEKIEQELEDNENLAKPKILHISSSPMGGLSFSRIIGEKLTEKISEKKEESVFTSLDLSKEKSIFINDEFVKYINNVILYDELSEETRKILKTAENYAEILRNADAIIISCPIYNMSIPASLKSFLELSVSYIKNYLGEKMLDVPVCRIVSMSGHYSEMSDALNINKDSLSMSLYALGLTKQPDLIIADDCQIVNTGTDIPNDIMDKINSVAEKFSAML